MSDSKEKLDFDTLVPVLQTAVRRALNLDAGELTDAELRRVLRDVYVHLTPIENIQRFLATVMDEPDPHTTALRALVEALEKLETEIGIPRPLNLWRPVRDARQQARALLGGRGT